MAQPAHGYESYLLRLWETHRDGKTCWRASLESTRTGTRQNFATLDELFAFLEHELADLGAPKKRARKKSAN